MRNSRHTCATHLLQGKADLRHVQQVLGHKSIETTAIYTRVSVEDLRRAISAAHPSERRWQRSARQRDARRSGRRGA